ncbi:uncharacterized protein LALA0_S06e00584g [Lachancea lanzarotensis]|uniref:LALA0S06e00584g1_1 n=1 Tax=Lachancea lanzarotensis TaxID=1245769 RepID=A0A0C7NAX6_9SACH|nr:uncharacterized protein LALA0_S06e00584g [Lachancea lanzarotensis]CEP62652.1 LALA0S06e00584g1_1 [Lachancea lanzarotensis]
MGVLHFSFFRPFCLRKEITRKKYSDFVTCRSSSALMFSIYIYKFLGKLMVTIYPGIYLNIGHSAMVQISFAPSLDCPQLSPELFTSYLSWRLHNLVKASYLFVWLFATACFSLAAAIISKEMGNWFSETAKVCVFLSLAALFKSIPFWKTAKLVPELYPQLAKEVAELGPNYSPKDWDLLAQHANEFLFKEGLWHSKLYFYDGEECLHCFRCSVYLPTVRTASEKRNGQLALAAQIYEKSLGNYWNAWEAAENTQVEAPRQYLPKDRYRFSILYDWAYGAKHISYFPLLWMLCSLWSGRKNDSRTVDLSTFGGLVVVFYTICMFWERPSAKEFPLTPIQILKFLKLVAELKPGQSDMEWDGVARKMNAFLNETGGLRIINYFFDGKECRAKFQLIMAKVIPNSGIEKSSFPELIKFASEFKTI